MFKKILTTAAALGQRKTTFFRTRLKVFHDIYLQNRDYPSRLNIPSVFYISP